jgi:hypothetical protein
MQSKIFNCDFSRFKYLARFKLDCFNSKKGLHTKQLQRDPMYMCVVKNNRILPVPEIMQGMSTSPQTKEEMSLKNNSLEREFYYKYSKI